MRSRIQEWRSAHVLQRPGLTAEPHPADDEPSRGALAVREGSAEELDRLGLSHPLLATHWLDEQPVSRMGSLAHPDDAAPGWQSFCLTGAITRLVEASGSR